MDEMEKILTELVTEMRHSKRGIDDIGERLNSVERNVYPMINAWEDLTKNDYASLRRLIRDEHQLKLREGLMLMATIISILLAALTYIRS